MSHQAISTIFIGNPGTGKSTLLNALCPAPDANDVVFKSGVAFGHGLTTVCQREKDKHGNVFIDTPGLSDIALRKQAAEEISNALSEGGLFKVFFVMTIESGRIRPDDKTTMKLVHDAAPAIGNAYSIIVNKIPCNTQRKLATDDDTRKEFLASLLLDMPPTGHVAFLPKVEELEDADNVVFTFPPNVLQFINAAPVVDIPIESVKKIETDMYESMLGKLSEQLDQMKHDNATLRATMEKQREQYAQELEASRKRQEELQKENKEAMEKMQKAMEEKEKQSKRQDIFGKVLDVFTKVAPLIIPMFSRV
eukprot:TRINITY_DN1038_c1_g3_i6.p2 TRINITY_DN1038_c1_g3~~TRINITY_DN1038_c1_g3_i6.p2  ORF type:complete len:308 (-),score=109.78 TRINITY_DN1038_c1_g3_i6:304-1227(-)